MKLIELIKRHEGVSQKLYTDTTGNLTIGIGRNVEDVGISIKEALFLLSEDIARCTHEAESNFKWFIGLDETRRDVIISMIFNLGLEKFKQFKKMIAYMEAGDFTAASCEMLTSKWAAQVKGRAKELAKMMKTGEYLELK